MFYDEELPSQVYSGSITVQADLEKREQSRGVRGIAERAKEEEEGEDNYSDSAEQPTATAHKNASQNQEPIKEETLEANKNSLE